MTTMNKAWRVSSGLMVLAATMMIVGCDWSSGGGSSGYNTSQGAGVNINFSGVYRGELSGGRAVSGANITTLTISQTGNRLSAVDNNGSRYEGSFGSPGLVANANNGTYPPGAELVQGQVNFSGVNNATGKKIQFAGIVHVVTITDVQGDTTTSTSTSSAGTNNTSNVSINTGPVSVNTEYTNNDQTTTTTTLTTTFSIDSSNANYRMEGTWVEEGGGTYAFKARSPGTSGLITTATTTPATTAAP